MAHNFKLEGNIYVSKDGNDANPGTKDSPKLTLSGGVAATGAGGTLVIGSGVYYDGFTRASNAGIVIIGDGTVILDGRSLYNISSSGSSGITTLWFRNVTIQNYLNISVSGATNAGALLYFSSCIIINCNPRCNGGTSNNYSGVSCANTILINSSIAYVHGNQSASFASYGSSIFINSVVSEYITSLMNCYFDSTSLIDNIDNIVAGTAFDFNNIQGRIRMLGGVYSGQALSFAQHRVYYSSYNANSMSVDPKFNDVQNLNFTLQADSPHILAASDYRTNIGGTEYAVYKSANSDEFTVDATVTDLTLLGDNSYSITNPATEGRIITGPISIQWPITKPLTKIEWCGNLNFNKSITAGTSGNENVPAYYTETTGAGASPDRLTILMRYSTQQTEPAVSGDWDNGGYWTAGNWVEVEVNAKPKVDGNSVGSGDPLHINFSGVGDIAPSWIQLDIKLRNDYNP